MKEISVKVNQQPMQLKPDNGYMDIDRIWKTGDVIEIDLPMEVRQTIANAKVKVNIGKITIEYRPVAYCTEFADNNGHTLST